MGPTFGYLDFPQNLTTRLGKTCSSLLLPKSPGHEDQPARVVGLYYFHTIDEFGRHRPGCSASSNDSEFMPYVKSSYSKIARPLDRAETTQNVAQGHRMCNLGDQATMRFKTIRFLLFAYSYATSSNLTSCLRFRCRPECSQKLALFGFSLHLWACHGKA